MMEQRRVSRPSHERIGHELVGLKSRCLEVWCGLVHYGCVGNILLKLIDNSLRKYKGN